MTAHDAREPATFSPPPPAKRLRLASVAADDAAIVAASHPCLATAPAAVSVSLSASSATPAGERLHYALTRGVFRFLALDDASAVIHACRLLRTDAQLIASFVRASPDFSSVLSTAPNAIFRLPREWVKAITAATTPPEQAAQVVSTAAFLKKRVLRWCCDVATTQRPDEDDDLLCSVQPVLMPLALLADKRVAEPQETAPPPTKWSRQAIIAALNNLCPTAGERFFDFKTPAQSRFATHWDSIYIDRVSGRVSCRLCDAARDAVALYQRQVDVGLRQYTLMLRRKEETWARDQKTPEEVAALTREFYANSFPTDAYIRPEAAQWPAPALLRHICAHGKMQSWQIGDTRARGVASVDAFLRALSSKYQHQCRSFYQPLKRSLNTKGQVVGRIPPVVLENRDHLRVLQGQKDEDGDSSQRVLTELVGAVDCTTGIFTGAQVTFRLSR